MRPKRIEPEPQPAAAIEGLRPFTAKQGQYLAFIYYYGKIHGTPPAESDFQRYFRVTPPVVHQMIKTLHARGFIDREPGKARSIKLRLTRAQLPDLDYRQLTDVVQRRAALRGPRMDEFSDIWIEQCEAARDIRDAWGTRKALEYLIGEKLLNYIRASDSDPSWAAKLPLFAAEISRIFTTEELRMYFATTTRVGPAAHVATKEQYQTMRDAGAFDEDAVSGAADAILFERARVLLLGGAPRDEPL